MKDKPTTKMESEYNQDEPFFTDSDEEKKSENVRIHSKDFEEEDLFTKQSKEEEIQGVYELRKQLKESQQAAAEDRDRLLRVMADFENYKKRMNRQNEDYRKYANEALLKDLLTVVDNLERAICSSESAIDNPKESCVVEGVEMTLNEILKILEKYKVIPIEAHGKPFDPAFHEAVMQQESDEFPENTVINVLQKGYTIHDRLLRPAMVVVSKGR